MSKRKADSCSLTEYFAQFACNAKSSRHSTEIHDLKSATSSNIAENNPSSNVSTCAGNTAVHDDACQLSTGKAIIYQVSDMTDITSDESDSHSVNDLTVSINVNLPSPTSCNPVSVDPSADTLAAIPVREYENDTDRDPVHGVEKAKKYIHLGPYQPKIKFPATKKLSKTDKTRKFREQWYTLYNWLEYSPTLDRAFCFHCRLFATGSTGTGEEFYCHWFPSVEKWC
jgi:hypothetical protein